MRPYGWQQNEWRGDDHGPSSKHRKLGSKARSTSRRILHKRGRRESVSIIRAAMSCLLLLVVGCGPIGGGRVLPVNPSPVETIEHAAASSLRLYHERLAAAFTTLAGEIEQGGIEDDEDLANRMEELTKTARLGSFEAFRSAWAKQSGLVTEWDAGERAERCRDTARGFKR